MPDVEERAASPSCFSLRLTFNSGSNARSKAPKSCARYPGAFFDSGMHGMMHQLSVARLSHAPQAGLGGPAEESDGEGQRPHANRCCEPEADIPC